MPNQKEYSKRIHDLILERRVHELKRLLVTIEAKAREVLNLPDSTGTTPLQAAIDTGVVDIVILLIDWGADVNYISESSCYTALTRAVETGRMDLAILLLESGADPNLCMPDHSSAMHVAEFRGNSEFIALFKRYSKH